MFFIPGWLITLITFPGVICHEIAHRFFCDLASVPVYEVCYFRMGNPSGYVIHEPAQSLKSAFLISIGPLIVNTVLCSVITFCSIVTNFMLDVTNRSLASVVLIRIGLSIGMHSFPSDADMQSFADVTKDQKTWSVARLAGKCFGALFAVANVLRFVWFDAAYAFAVALVLPLVAFGFRAVLPDLALTLHLSTALLIYHPNT